MTYIPPKPDIRYFDESINSRIESHSHAQLRAEVAKARADEREACAQVCDDWPNGRDDVYSIGVAIRARSNT